MKNSAVYLIVLVIVLLFSSTVVNAQTPTMKIGGYVQNWLILREGTEGIANAPALYTSGFRIRRARLGFKGDISEMFNYNVLLEFAGSQNILLDFASTVKIDPAFNITVGQFIAPTQMYETSTISSANTECLEISDIASTIYTTMNLDSYRDVGLMASGNIDMVKYGAYFGNGRGRFNYASRTGIISRKFGDGLIGGRIDIEPLKNIIVGGHYARNNQESVDSTSSGLSSKKLDRQTFSALVNVSDASGMLIRAEYAGGKNKDNPAKESSFKGYYILFGYKFNPQIQGVLRYEWMEVKTGGLVTGEHQTLVLGGTYFFMKEEKEIAKLQLNYFARTETSPTPSVDNDLLLLGLQIKF
ncbi:MAG: porin [Bacteroidota bacterium]